MLAFKVYQRDSEHLYQRGWKRLSLILGQLSAGKDMERYCMYVECTDILWMSQVCGNVAAQACCTAKDARNVIFMCFCMMMR
jgi:hypothetical protein